MEFEEKTLERQPIFEGKVVTLVKDKVSLPNGATSYRELVLHRGAVAVLALTPEGKIILVKQYRKAIEAISYEIPAGKLEIGEAGQEAQAALRELEEETGYTSQSLEKVYDFYTAIGFSNERISLYLAKDLVKVPHPRPQDEDEFIECLELSLEECQKLIEDGAILDAKTIMALQYLALNPQE